MIDPSAGDRMSGIPRERWAIVQEFRAARKDLYDTLTQVRERIPHLDIHCGNNDSLWLRRCVDGLKSFYYALHEVPASTTLTIDKLVIVEHMWDSSHVEFRTETVKKKTFNILEFSFRITPSPLARKILDSQTTVSQHTKNDLRSPVQLLGDRR